MLPGSHRFTFPATCCNSQEGRARSAGGRFALGGGEDELLAQRPQEIGVVYREGGSGHRLLDRALERGHSGQEAHPRGLGSLPLGGPTLPQTIAYWRKLLQPSAY